jgi:hypothetical protein
VIRVYDAAGNVIMLHQPKGWRKKNALNPNVGMNDSAR